MLWWSLNFTSSSLILGISVQFPLSELPPLRTTTKPHLFFFRDSGVWSSGEQPLLSPLPLAIIHLDVGEPIPWWLVLRIIHYLLCTAHFFYLSVWTYLSKFLFSPITAGAVPQSVFLSFLSICLFVWLFVCLYECLSVFLSFYMSVYLAIYLTACLKALKSIVNKVISESPPLPTFSRLIVTFLAIWYIWHTSMIII